MGVGCLAGPTPALKQREQRDWFAARVGTVAAPRTFVVSAPAIATGARRRHQGGAAHPPDAGLLGHHPPRSYDDVRHSGRAPVNPPNVRPGITGGVLVALFAALTVYVRSGESLGAFVEVLVVGLLGVLFATALVTATRR